MEFQDHGLTRLMRWVIIPFMWFIPVAVLRSMFVKDAGFTAGYNATLGGDNYKLLGKTMTHIHPILALHDLCPCIPISVSSFTHSNQYELTFAVNPQHFPDRSAVEKMSKGYLQEELEKLAKESFP
jgi:hypothetical protein